MEKFVNSKNFIVKYLILELFEKLHRLRKYIKTCEKFDKKNNSDKIINLFKSSIEIIGNEVYKLCEDVNDDLDDEMKFANILKISQNSKAIIRIHEELKNLHSSWILPEIKTFTNEIINQKTELRDEINIILSDSYTFLERNLGKKFENLLSQTFHGIDIKPIKDNHSFFLPKIEFSNPLNWTIIVHEAGHLRKKEVDALRESVDIMPDDIQSSNMDIIKNWAEEIFCDIYATSILGPAYFISFVSFALLSAMDFGILSYSNIHPSIVIRAAIIINFLKDNDLIFETVWGVEDYTRIFNDCLMEQKEILNDTPKNAIKGLTKFNRNLRKLIKDLQLTTFSIDNDDSIRIRKLVESLNKGVPIGSVCDEESDEARQLIKKAEINLEELDKLKSLISERSCKVWEILNAGWIFKLECSCEKGDKIFFGQYDDSKDVMDRIDEYGIVVDFLDERLLSSINTSQIIKIIENN